MTLTREGRTLLSLSLILLAFLTVLAWEFDYFSWDLILADMVQASGSPAMHYSMVLLAWLGKGWVPWVLSILTGLTVWFSCDSCRRWTLIFWAGLGAGAAVMALLKVVTMRPRPYSPLVQVLAEYPGFSYPSGHVVFFVQYFGFLYLLVCTVTDKALIRRLALITLGMPVVLVGYSRVYTGAHWPSDVLGGYLLGGVLLALMVGLHRR